MATKKKTSASTTAKKAALKTSEKKVKTAAKPTKSEKVVHDSPQTSSSAAKNHTAPKASRPAIRMKIKKSYVITVLALIALGLLLYSLRGYFIVATVNGQPVTRLAVVRELEKQYGSQGLESLIVKTLVEQEAQKKHISVSQNEVNDELKKNEDILKQNGQTLDQFLQYRGITRDYYLEGLRLQLLAKKIVGPVNLTDKQISDYMDQNKDQFTQYKTDAEKKAAAKDQLESQEVGNKINDWLQKLRNSAKINYIYKY